MSRGRQQQHSEAVRNQIISIARRIVSEEGTDALSIRRVTREMGYSVGIIYHYFENKERLLACVLEEGYARILAAVSPLDERLPPNQAIREAFIRYVEHGLSCAAEYRALMFSSSPQVLAFTSVLGEGACEMSPALRGLAASINEGIAQGLFAPCDAQLTAQAIWSAMFGLLARLLIEQDIPDTQRARLMNRQIDLIMKGLEA